jgi:two-component system, LuxR family, response regulator FixJ
VKNKTPAVLILVDDDAAVLSSLKFALEVDGFAVRAYADAEGLLSASDMPEAGCLILDYWLPGLDGLELLTELRLRGVDLPAILITTPTPQVCSKAAAVGVQVVEKPLLAGALLDSVRELLQL